MQYSALNLIVEPLRLVATEEKNKNSMRESNSKQTALKEINL
jgi:hypothetical protein